MCGIYVSVSIFSFLTVNDFLNFGSKIAYRLSVSSAVIFIILDNQLQYGVDNDPILVLKVRFSPGKIFHYKDRKSVV